MDALPLSPAQRELVAANLVRLPHVLRADYRGYVRRLGWDEAYQVGSYALCRAARSWAGKCPFRYYAAFWLRALLTAAVQELDRRHGALRADVPSPLLPPDRVAQLRGDAATCLAHLHQRQRKYAELAAAGYTQAEIGERMGVRRSRIARLRGETIDRVTRRFPALRSH
jgi:RNA polymerase sigma factor (sigma-70 family)